MDFEVIFRRAWDVFKVNIAAYVIATLIAFIGSIFIVTIAPLFYGLAYMAVKGMGGEKVEVNDLFEGFNNFIKSWVFFILFAIIVGIGFMFFILPGLVLSILMIYALPLLVIRGYGVMDSIKESIDISKKHLVDTLVLAIILWVISAIGGMVYVGSLLTTPFYFLALVAALEAQMGAEQSYAAEYTEVSDIE